MHEQLHIKKNIQNNNFQFNLKNIYAININTRTMNKQELIRINKVLSGDIADSQMDISIINQELENHIKNREMLITAIKAVIMLKCYSLNLNLSDD